MLPDSVVDEVRAVREAYAERFNYDLALICRDANDQAEKAGMKLVSLPPKRVTPVEPFPPPPDIVISAGGRSGNIIKS